ncbi:MAG: hypothetical protein B7Y31_12955 [Novosphingobium sp. 16-62-11]|nr:MAG: hypothetical protein B7Y31_12955 [Novosphingobium sp. 16-62-11]
MVRTHGTKGREAEQAMELAGVRQSIANLRTFPFVQRKEHDGELQLRGAFFSISDGLLHVLDKQTGEFAPAV